MAGRETADIVFCMDASGSMSPTFEGVRNHVFELLDSLKADLQRSWDVRFDFLAYNTAYNCDGKAGMVFDTVKKRNMEVLDGLYRSSGDANGGSASGFFTSDVNEFRSALQRVECDGDETSAPAIDMAADFPFRDASTCHRVVILLTDERMEDGTCVQESNSKLAALATKLQDRGIMLYMVTPRSDMYDTLSPIDKCEWMVVGDDSNGLSNVDFGKLMQTIGKSVSVSQTGKGAAVDPRPLFNEANWTDEGECIKTDMEA
ncbi:MAG: VWA domain-containing protein [Kiritimatiellae bacterium]|nr:VWA domain-containing protein [Kiritimatiellia bacterium]